jgi:hypothetical protein
VSKPKKFVKGGRLYVDVHDVIDDPVKLDALIEKIADEVCGPETKEATGAGASKPQPRHKVTKSPEHDTSLSGYSKRLSAYSDEELVERFNGQVGVTVWVGARGRYLHALRLEFDRRGIDYSCVDKGGLSLRRKVKLVGKKLKIAPGQKKLPAK